MNKPRWLTPVLLLLVAALAFSGALEALYLRLGGSALRALPTEHLDRSIDHARALLGPVALARGGADVLEGSTAVVEWGDLAQPVLDYLTLAWKALLAALVALLTLRAVWEGLGGAGGWLAGGAALCLLLARHVPALAGAPGVRTWLDGLRRGFLRGWLLLWVLLPAAWAVGGRAVERVQEPLRRQAAGGFAHAGSVFTLDSVVKADSWLDRTGALQDKMGAVSAYIRNGGLGELGVAVVSLTVVHVLDSLLLPAAMAWLSWLLLRAPAAGGREKTPAGGA